MCVLIISLSHDDSSSRVIDWLFIQRLEFMRLNSDWKECSQLMNLFNLNELNDIQSYWYRKGSFLRGFKNSFDNQKLIEKIMFEHLDKIYQFIELKLCQKKHINGFYSSNPNKLIVLEKAKAKRLLTPQFFLSKELKKNETVEHIYKPINEGIHLSLDDYIGYVFTRKYNNKKLSKYGLTFFQKLIEKKYELRIFYLDGQFWSMAIFSQSDDKTKIDFRHYNEEKPNRNIPFKLPKEIEGKLNLLMKDLNLNSGSIDMIVSKDREYYFLEVNPVGQFGMVSYPCNYYLEKEIAEYLSYD
ncbi:MAG TPA: grasp-with-spasm system ATP-grasp peptide maturase [Moheibacter sp.]|nr:grasp-with-spasm system ATP-grasp peptide maturase [Moheibacter sp.]